MNLLKIFDDINQADPEFADRISPRRAAIKNITSFGSKVAVAALPFAFSTLFKKAYGQQTTTAINAVLNFALGAEYLESSFYNTYGQRSNVPSTDLPGIDLIRVDENNHVAFLKGLLGTSAATQPTYDFTAGGVFSTITDTGTTGYLTFLRMAQAFEDTGVRAYKGQAANLLGNQVYLTAALNIHSVEARHASHLRRLRILRDSAVSGVTSFKPWVSGQDTVASGLAAGTAAQVTATNMVYQGENTTTQGGVNILGLSGFTSASIATEAFDEPLGADQVTAILKLFIK